MTMVVFYHCICCYGIWQGTFVFSGVYIDIWMRIAVYLNYLHVPTFFFISGYLFIYQGFTSKTGGGGKLSLRYFIKKKAVKILLPYIVVGSFLCILQHREFVQLPKGISHLWFLLTIFECYFFFYIIKGLFTERNSIYILVISILFLYAYYIHPFHFFNIGLFIKYAPYYAIGMSLCKTNFLKNQQIQKYSKYLFFIICLCYLSWFYLNGSHGIALLIALALIIVTFTLMESQRINNIPSVIQSLDKCSMGIYITHHIVIQEMNKISIIEPFLQTHYYLYPFLQFCFVLPLSWIIVFTLQKYTFSKYIIG